MAIQNIENSAAQKPRQNNPLKQHHTNVIVDVNTVDKI
jgi:hypothetical protein